MTSNSNKIILAVLALGVVAYIAFVFDGPYSDAADSFETCVGMGYPVMESYPRQCRDDEGNLFVEDVTVPVDPMIGTTTGGIVGGVSDPRVSLVMPAAGATVSSPLQVSGTARGPWFFEASFPVQVIGADGTILGSGIAQAQGDWMTEGFVPFAATVSFIPGTNVSGYVRLSKDNPSGLPENDAHVDVPVTFR
ncbi:MAG TPA: Gmad2 immunoglobulin-like domain-containing protein [Candidatus Paceibacterota bacterium]